MGGKVKEVFSPSYCVTAHSLQIGREDKIYLTARKKSVSPCVVEGRGIQDLPVGVLV